MVGVWLNCAQKVVLHIRHMFLTFAPNSHCCFSTALSTKFRISINLCCHHLLRMNQKRGLKPNWIVSLLLFLALARTSRNRFLIWNPLLDFQSRDETFSTIMVSLKTMVILSAEIHNHKKAWLIHKKLTYSLFIAR